MQTTYEQYLRQWVQVCDTIMQASQHCPKCGARLEVQDMRCPYCWWGEEEMEDWGEEEE